MTTLLLSILLAWQAQPTTLTVFFTAGRTITGKADLMPVIQGVLAEYDPVASEARVQDCIKNGGSAMLCEAHRSPRADHEQRLYEALKEIRDGTPFNDALLRHRLFVCEQQNCSQ